MKLTAKCEYACLAMLQLAQDFGQDSPTALRNLAAQQNIPEGFLVQILQELRRAGLVTSTRGACGGYRLAHPPGQITLGEVLAHIDGPELVASNLPNPTPLSDALQSVCEELQQARLQKLHSLSLAELADRVTTAHAPMWYI